MIPERILLIKLNVNTKFFLSNFQNYCHATKNEPRNAVNSAFLGSCTLFKLAKFGLMQVILMRLSILFCIDNLYFFHTLFFVSHIFSTNPVPLHFFIIVCSSGGLQVSFTTHRIIFCRFACPPMEIIIYIQYFCKKKFCGTNRQYHDCFLCTEQYQLPLQAFSQE